MDQAEEISQPKEAAQKPNEVEPTQEKEQEMQHNQHSQQFQHQDLEQNYEEEQQQQEDEPDNFENGEAEDQNKDQLNADSNQQIDLNQYQNSISSPPSQHFEPEMAQLQSEIESQEFLNLEDDGKEVADSEMNEMRVSYESNPSLDEEVIEADIFQQENEQKVEDQLKGEAQASAKLLDPSIFNESELIGRRNEQSEVMGSKQFELIGRNEQSELIGRNEQSQPSYDPPEISIHPEGNIYYNISSHQANQHQGFHASDSHHLASNQEQKGLNQHESLNSLEQDNHQKDQAQDRHGLAIQYLGEALQKQSLGRKSALHEEREQVSVILLVAEEKASFPLRNNFNNAELDQTNQLANHQSHAISFQSLQQQEYCRQREQNNQSKIQEQKIIKNQQSTHLINNNLANQAPPKKPKKAKKKKNKLPKLHQEPVNEQRFEDAEDQNQLAVESLPIDELPIQVKVETGQQTLEAEPDLNALHEAELEKLKKEEISHAIVLKEAQKERIGTTCNMFREYILEHQKICNSHKLVIHNVSAEIEKKKSAKKVLLNVMTNYLQSYSKMAKDFYQKTYKFEQNLTVGSPNAFINLKQQLKVGYDELIFLRKSTGNDFQKVDSFIQSQTIHNLQKAFADYWQSMAHEEVNRQSKKIAYEEQEKYLKKRIVQLDKIYRKGMEGAKRKEDLFVETVKFIHEEKIYRDVLRQWGKSLIDYHNVFLKCENQLIRDIELTLNAFKTACKDLYHVGKKKFQCLNNLQEDIQEAMKFQKLCTLTDVDFIIYVMEIQTKKESKQFHDSVFLQYLEMNFFDKIVGDIHDLLKGATSKIFQLNQRDEELVNTISGNLIHFNRRTDQCKDQFSLKNVNAKIVGDGVIEFDELLKGIIFNENRTVRLRLRDADRAEQLICYLDEKAEEYEKIGELKV